MAEAIMIYLVYVVIAIVRHDTKKKLLTDEGEKK